jgi:hypothetical protein
MQHMSYLITTVQSFCEHLGAAVKGSAGGRPALLSGCFGGRCAHWCLMSSICGIHQDIKTVTHAWGGQMSACAQLQCLLGPFHSGQELALNTWDISSYMYCFKQENPSNQTNNQPILVLIFSLQLLNLPHCFYKANIGLLNLLPLRSKCEDDHLGLLLLPDFAPTALLASRLALVRSSSLLSASKSVSLT